MGKGRDKELIKLRDEHYAVVTTIGQKYSGCGSTML